MINRGTYFKPFNSLSKEFLGCFPSVTRDMACRVLERSESALLAPA
jgi:hypothetical protein